MRSSFKDISNQIPKIVGSARDTLKEEKCVNFILPSIHQLDF